MNWCISRGAYSRAMTTNEKIHEKIMAEFNDTPVENLINYSDPDYTWYIPKRRTNGAYRYLVKCTNFHHRVNINGDTIAVYLPEHVDTFVIYSQVYNLWIPINEFELNIDTILEQTRALPNMHTHNTSEEILGYKRYSLPEPYIGDSCYILFPTRCTVYIEAIYGMTTPPVIYSNLTDKYYAYTRNYLIDPKYDNYMDSIEYDTSKVFHTNSGEVQKLICENVCAQ